MDSGYLIKKKIFMLDICIILRRRDSQRAFSNYDSAIAPSLSFISRVRLLNSKPATTSARDILRSGQLWRFPQQVQVLEISTPFAPALCPLPTSFGLPVSVSLPAVFTVSKMVSPQVYVDSLFLARSHIPIPRDLPPIQKKFRGCNCC